MTTPCSCTGPGFCTRHGFHKNPHLYDLCQTREDYRELWDSQAGYYPLLSESDLEEPRRRESICRACENWTSESDGCGLMRPCERHSLTRALWHRDEPGCREGRWDPPAPIGHYFDRAVVVNLKRRPDRLAQFFRGLPADAPFPRPIIIEATDGRGSDYPESWASGRGSWGCRCSHVRILNQAIQDNVQRLLVFEDDCVFEDHFSRKLQRFLQRVPAWDCLMIGGQHRSGRPLDSGVRGIVRCQNTQRTHAYAVQGQFMRDLRDLWAGMTTGHIDHRMGPFAARYRTFAPAPFLCGQSAGRSDITNRQEIVRFWSGKQKTTVIQLRAKRQEVLRAFRTRKSQKPATTIATCGTR